MEQQHRSLTRKIFLAVLAAVMCIASLCGGMLFSRSEETVTSEPVTADAASSSDIKLELTVLKLINDINYPINVWTFNGVHNVAGRGDNTFENKGYSGGEYRGTNKNLSSLTTLVFKKNPTTIDYAKNENGGYWYWDYMNNTSSPKGPYKIETSVYALSINGQMYLPYGGIALGMQSSPGFFIGSDIVPIGAGGTVYASDLLKKHGGTPTDVTSIWLPLDGAGWLQWDDKGRAYFQPHETTLGTYYITVNNNGVPSATTNGSDSNIPTKPSTQSIPEAQQSAVTAWEKTAEGSANSYGTYDGTGNAHCPVEESAFYTVDEITPPEGGKIGDAGTYTATVTPKENYAWDDSGDVAPKTITWTVGKAENTVELSQNSANFGQKDNEVRIPLTLGELSNLEGATFTYTKNGQPCTDIEARIDTVTHDLVLKRLTKDAVSDITVEVNIPESKNFNEKTLGPVNVTLEAGEGFYLAGKPDKIYATLAEALEAAAKEGAEATVHVRGNVTVDATTALTLPNSLTLKGDADSTLTVTGGSLFTVGSGKSLTLDGLTVDLQGGATLANVTGGTLTLNDSHVENAASTAVTASGEGANVTFTGNNHFTNCKSSANGGALSVGAGATVGGNGSVSFESCGGQNGGAMYVGGGTVDAAELALTFDGCTAENGGAVYVESGTFTGRNLTVSSCAAAENGGAVYVGAESTVTLGDGTSTHNNLATKGNGVYVADGATLALSTTGATNIQDGIMLGHAEGVEGNASIKLEGPAPADGKTIVVEFENAAEQLKEGTGNAYITSETLDSAALKSFMRVKNAGYTFDPSADDNTLGLTTADSNVAWAEIDGNRTAYPSVQAAIDAIAASTSKQGTVYVSTYQNASDLGLNTTEVVLNETLKIPGGVEITLKSGTIKADGSGTVTYEESTDPVTLKRGGTLFEEMIKVESGATLNVENVTLDGGAVWNKANPESGGTWTAEAEHVKIKDDGNGGAGTVETNNSAVVAHAPVIVNAGTLNLESGSTIQNNDNNYALPGQGFGSENYGGGVRNQGKGQLTMKEGATIKDCYSREGGAILNVNKPQKTGGGDNPAYVEGGKPTVEIKGGEITGNVSQTKGAAIQTVYGGAKTTVSGGTLKDNVSLRDLGVLSVEEGGSLTVEGGEVSAKEGANALYLYNQYSAKDYEGATTKPYIEGKNSDNVGKLNVKGQPTITGNVHVDASCYVVDVQDGIAVDSDIFYDSYVDVTDYTGSKLHLTYGEGDGKIAKGDNLAEQIEYQALTQTAGAKKDTYTFTYTDENGTYLAQGSYDLAFSQTEVNKLHVEGKVDPACTSVTVTINGKDYNLVAENGVIDFTIDVSDSALDKGAFEAELKLTYGDNTVTQKLQLAAVLKDGEGKCIFPEGTQYKNEEGTFKDLPTDVLPDDLALDTDGKATFTWTSPEETTVTLSVGSRETAPSVNGKMSDLKDVTDTSLELQLKEGEKDKGLEYQLRDEEGNAVSDWMTPDENGVLNFGELAAGTKYSLYARTPAKDGTLPSAAVACGADVYTTLTADQQAKRNAFETAFDGKFELKEGAYSLKEDGTTVAELKGILDAYDAFTTSLDTYTGSEEVLALFAEKLAAVQAAYDKALAKEWLTEERKTTLQQAANYVAEEGTTPFPEAGSAADAEALKKALATAYTEYAALTEGAKNELSTLLTNEGVDSPLEAYIKVAKKDMSEDIAGLGEDLQTFGEAFLETLNHAGSVTEVDSIVSNFGKAQDAATAIQKAYADAVTKAGGSNRTKALLDETLSALYEELVTAENYEDVSNKAADEFNLDLKRGAAQDAFVEAFDAVAKGVMDAEFDKVQTSDFMGVDETTGQMTVKDQEKFDLYTVAQNALRELATAEDTQLATVLKDAVKGLVEDHILRDGDSAAVKAYLNGVATAVDNVTDTDALTEIVNAVSKTGEAQKSVTDTLSEMRAAELNSAIKDYKDIYKLLKGADAPADVNITGKDASEVNTSWKTAVEALLAELENGASPELKSHIKALLDEVGKAYTTAENETNRTVAKAFEALKALENTRLEAAKGAAKEALAEYYETLTGEAAEGEDYTKFKQGLTDELANVELTDSVPAALESVDKALKDAVNDVIDSLKKDGDSKEVTNYLESVKTAVTDEAGALTADDMTGLSDLESALKDVQTTLESKHNGELTAAQDAFKEYYQTLKGGEPDADTLASIQGDNISDLNDALAQAVKALLDELTANDSNDVKDVVTAAETEIDNAVTAAKGEAVDLTTAVATAKRGIDTQRETEKEQATDQYFKAYQALTGETTQEVPGAIQNATTCGDLNAALKGEIGKLLDELAANAGGAENIQDITDAVKTAVENAMNDKRNTISDLTNVLAGVKDDVDLRKAKNDAQADLTKEADRLRKLVPDCDTAIETALEKATQAVEGAKDTTAVEGALENGLSALQAAALPSFAANAFEAAYKAVMGEDAEGLATALDNFKEQIAGKTDADSLNQALKAAVEKLVEAEATDGARLQAAKEALKAEINGAQPNETGILDFTDALNGAKEMLDLAKAQDAAIADYKAAYEAVKGTAYPEDDSDLAAKAVVDALGNDTTCPNLTKVNEQLKAGVDALLGELSDANTNGSPTLKGLITAAQTAVTAEADAATQGNRLAQFADEVANLKKNVDTQHLADSKTAAEDAFKTYYNTLTGNTADGTDALTALETALGGITLDNNDLNAALADVNEALKDAVNGVLDGLVSEADSAETQKYITDPEKGVKKQVTDATADAYSGLSDLTQTLKGVKATVEANRNADVKAAQEALVDAYNAAMGANVTLQEGALPTDAPEDLVAAFGEVGKAQNHDGAMDALEAQLEKLLDSLVTNKDSKEAHDIVDGVKGELQSAIESAKTDGTTPNLDCVEGTKSNIDDQKAKDLAAVVAEYNKEYEALTGSAPETVPTEITSAQNVTDANTAMKHAIAELLDNLLAKDGDNVLDSKAVETLIEAAKGSVNSATADNNGVSDLSEIVDGVTGAIDEQRNADVQAAKDAYEAAYKALTGETEADEQKEPVKSALDAIGEATNAKEANDALKKAVDELIDSYVKREGDSQNIKDYLDSVKEGVNAAIDAANGTNRTVPDLKGEITVDEEQKKLDELKTDLDSKRQAEREAAKDAYKEYYNAVTGNTADETASPVKDVLDRLDAAKDNAELNDILKEAVTADLGGLVTEGDAPDARTPVTEAQAAVEKLFDDAKKDGTAADSAAVQEAVKGVRELVETKRGESKDTIKDNFKELYETLTGETVPTNPDGSLADNAPKAVKDAYAAIESGTTTEADQAMKDAAKELIDNYLKDTDSQKAKSAAEKAKDLIDEAECGENGTSDLSDIVENLKNTVEGERFLDSNDVLRKDFDDLEASDLDDLNSAKEAAGALPQGVKEYLSDESGYSSPESEIEDKINKAEFEQKKDAKIEELDSNAKECDGEYVTEKFKTEREKIEATDYAPCTDDSARETHKNEANNNLQETAENAVNGAKFAQEVQTRTAQAEETLKGLLDSGLYDGSKRDLKKELQDLYDAFVSDAEGLSVETKADGTLNFDKLDKLCDKLQGDFANANVAKVVTGDLKADGSVEDGTGDYAEGYEGPLWGVVTNDESMPGAIRLVIEETEEKGVDTIESAAKGGKLKPSVGTNYTVEEMKELVTGKKSVATLDIYLLMNNARYDEFTGKYQVIILLPEGMRGAEGLQVVYEKDGVVEVYETTVSEDGKYLSFTTDHFSEFTILADEAANLWWLIITLTAILGAELLFLLILLMKKDSKKGGGKTASVLPFGLLAMSLGNEIVTCAVLGLCVLGVGICLLVMTRKQKGENTEENESIQQ